MLMKNMKFKTKLSVLLGTAIGGLLIFGAVAFSTLHAVEINSELYQSIVLGNDVVADYVPPTESMLAANGLVLMMSQDPHNARKYLESLRELDKAFETNHSDYLKRVPDGKLRDAIAGQAFTTAREFLNLSENQYAPLVLDGKMKEASAFLNARLLPVYTQHEAAVDEVVKLANNQVKDNEQGAASLISSRTTALIVLGLVILTAMVICGGIIARGIVGPVAQIVKFLQALASGDLTGRLAVESQDEVGEMAESLNRATESMRVALSEVRSSAESMANSAHELASSSEELASGAQQQSSSLEETTASLEELTSTVKQNADNAKQASQVASGSRDTAEKGGQVVAEAVAAMGGINEASKNIAEIITTIDEIAFQTNLLALNAAVEAARAGEQGRGFAVVATEVRNLAQRSATSAKEIKRLIQDSVRKVENGSTLVNKSGETLQEIVGSVKRVTDIVTEIAAASREQSVGIEQANKAMVQMEQVTQANSSQTEELSANAQNLSTHAQQLQTLVQRFHLDAADNRPQHAAPAPVPAATRKAPPSPANLSAQRPNAQTAPAFPLPKVKPNGHDIHAANAFEAF